MAQGGGGKYGALARTCHSYAWHRPLSMGHKMVERDVMAGNTTSFPIAMFKIVILHFHLIHEEVIYGIFIGWPSDKHRYLFLSMRRSTIRGGGGGGG